VGRAFFAECRAVAWGNHIFASRQGAHTTEPKPRTVSIRHAHTEDNRGRTELANIAIPKTTDKHKHTLSLMPCGSHTMA